MPKQIKRKVKKVKLRKRKSKNQKGGVLIKEHKLLGVGSFGWIVTPAVPCKGNNPLYNKVSKFAKKQDVIDDIKVGKKLEKIDKSGKYFLYVRNSCKISTKKVEDILEFDFTDMAEEMKAEGEGPLIFYNLIMDKGDITIQEYFRKYSVSDKTVVKMLIKLLKGVEKLIKNGYVHTDLHNENIILKKTGRNKFEVVIIDFGDMATASEWKKYAEKNEDVESKKDFYEFGEVDMVTKVLSNVRRGSSKKLGKLLNKMYGYNVEDCLEELEEAGYDLKMDLQIEKKSKPKPPPKKSFFSKLFG